MARAAAAAGREASTRLAELDTAAAGLRSGKQGTPAIALAEGEQLLGPTALDPVVAGEAGARDAARRHYADQEAAHSQIRRAASLDTAIREATPGSAPWTRCVAFSVRLNSTST